MLRLPIFLVGFSSLWGNFDLELAMISCDDEQFWGKKNLMQLFFSRKLEIKRCSNINWVNISIL